MRGPRPAASCARQRHILYNMSRIAMSNRFNTYWQKNGKNIMKMWRLLGCGLLVCMLSRVAEGQELRVAAAADLQFAFQEVSARFQKETGHTVTLTFGSSGNFFSQIQNGAPFDVFLSADTDYPARLETAGLVEPGT